MAQTDATLEQDVLQPQDEVEATEVESAEQDAPEAVVPEIDERTSKDEQIQLLRAQLTKKDEEISALKMQVNEGVETIRNAQKKYDELQAQKNSIASQLDINKKIMYVAAGASAILGILCIYSFLK